MLKNPSKQLLIHLENGTKAAFRIDGGKVTFWLNGKAINEFDMESGEWKGLVAASKFAPMDYAKVRKGRIGLQDHGGPVSFRNIKIKVL